MKNSRVTAGLGIMFGVAVAVSLVLGACGGTAASGPVDSKLDETTYLAALDRWTDEAHVYDGFDSMLQVIGTCRSFDFRRAYVEKYVRDYQLDDAAAAKMMDDQAEAAGRSIEFLLAVSAPSKEKNNLASKDSAWRLLLESDDLGRLEPFEVREIKKKDAKLMGYFPYISPWAKVYAVRFLVTEPPPASGRLDLVLTGVLGTARLSYTMQQ
ncbi:MAG: hypothetical protein KKB20_15860 [Proteobacteria bacterium]|nr:hypothetical protein [Pseudomonadota bacterium]